MTRRADDAYLTADDLAQAITDRLATIIPAPATVLEPSAGEGAFVRAVTKTWPGAAIDAVEPRIVGPLVLQPARVWMTTLEQFTEEEPAPGAPPRRPRYDLVVGNPPYLCAESHVVLARKLGRCVAFLLRMSFLSSQGRVERLWDAQPGLRWLIPLAQRPSFTGKGTDNSEYAIFVWEDGFTGSARILPHLWVR